MNAEKRTKEEIKDLQNQIKQLKKEKGVTILAHFYQTPDVQEVADYIGDSLGLARIAQKEISTPHILFSAVRFMAETAAVLNPDKKVFLPAPSAGCPLADYLSGEKIEEFKRNYPDRPVIVYVNTTAETKAHADLCCTSSNAIKMVEKAAEKWDTNKFLFGPDKNLAAYVKSKTPFEILAIPGDGKCPVHDLFTEEHVKKAREAHPSAAVLVHPEAPFSVLSVADYVGSTAGMEKYVKEHPEQKEFIIGTENGLTEYLKLKYPDRTFYYLSEHAICKNMKKVTLENMLHVLKVIGTPEEKEFLVSVERDIAEKAVVSIERMIELS